MQYRITSDYGGLVVSRIVEAESVEDAWRQTGIGTDLVAMGYTLVTLEGEHTVELVDDAGDAGNGGNAETA